MNQVYGSVYKKQVRLVERYPQCVRPRLDYTHNWCCGWRRIYTLFSFTVSCGRPFQDCRQV